MDESRIFSSLVESFGDGDQVIGLVRLRDQVVGELLRDISNDVSMSPEMRRRAVIALGIYKRCGEKLLKHKSTTGGAVMVSSF